MEETRWKQDHLKELNNLQGKTILNLMDPAIFQIVNGIYTRHIRNNNEISLSDAVEIAEEQYKTYLDTPEESNVYLKAILKHRLGKEYNDDEIESILSGKKAFRERLIKETQEKKSVTPFTTSKRNVNQEDDSNTELSPKEFFKKLKNRQI